MRFSIAESPAVSPGDWDLSIISILIGSLWNLETSGLRASFSGVLLGSCLGKGLLAPTEETTCCPGQCCHWHIKADPGSVLWRQHEPLRLATLLAGDSGAHRPASITSALGTHLLEAPRPPTPNPTRVPSFFRTKALSIQANPFSHQVHGLSNQKASLSSPLRTKPKCRITWCPMAFCYVLGII